MTIRRGLTFALASALTLTFSGAAFAQAAGGGNSLPSDAKSGSSSAGGSSGNKASPEAKTGGASSSTSNNNAGSGNQGTGTAGASGNEK